MMNSTIQNFFSELRASYWYNPLLMTLAAIMLASLTLQIDHFAPEWIQKIGWINVKNPEGARVILSTIATSMITIASVTFSMTILAISFAASQIGPRITSNFMRDRSNQITLGTFIATFLYCLMILRSVLNQGSPIDLNQTAQQLAFVPQISLFVAIVLALISVMVLIYFIHHIPESIHISNVIADIGEQLNQQIESLYPINIGQEITQKTTKIPVKFQKFCHTISSKQHGYIRILDGKTLIQVAKYHDLIIQIEARPGSFVTEGSTLFYVYSTKKIDEDIPRECASVIVMGHKRNQEQDYQFLINEMIEIIARALSPGVNDPFTAQTAIDWLQLTLQNISKQNSVSPYRYDDEDQLRVIAHPTSFSEFSDLILGRIQPYVCKDKNVSMHMIEMIYKIHENITIPEHKITLRTHAESLKNAACECLPVLADRHAIESQYKTYFMVN